MTSEYGTETDEQPQLKRVMGPGLLLPFLVAFLSRRSPRSAIWNWSPSTRRPHGAALYTHKAFGIHFATFLVAFIVMCSGITSASTASRFFASNFFKGFGIDWGTAGIVGVALFFMIAVAAVNPRGVGESVKLNVVLTIVEISGLMLVIFVGRDQSRGRDQVHPDPRLGESGLGAGLARLQLLKPVLQQRYSM